MTIASRLLLPAPFFRHPHNSKNTKIFLYKNYTI